MRLDGRYSRFTPASGERWPHARTACFIIPVILCAVTVCPAPPETRGSVSQAAREARVALAAGRWAAAEKLLGPLVVPARLAELPAGIRVELLGLWGEVLFAREDPEAALAALEQALSSASDAARDALGLRLVECLLAVSEPEGARRRFTSLTEQERQKPQARFLNALVLYALEEEDEAGRLFEAVLESAPVAEAAHYLGVLTYDRGQPGAALKHFSTAIKLDPGDYYSRIYRARCLLDLNLAPRAERELRELRARRSTPEVSCLLGRALSRQRRDREALGFFRAATRERPEYAEALFGESSALRRLGEQVKAREAAEKFRRVHLRQERKRRRLEALHQESLRSPRRWQLHEAMARLGHESGDLEAAERHAWRALRIAPLEVSPRLLLARILVDRGRYQGAALHYQKVLRRNTQHETARTDLERLVREHARRER